MSRSYFVSCCILSILLSFNATSGLTQEVDRQEMDVPRPRTAEDIADSLKRALKRLNQQFENELVRLKATVDVSADQQDAIVKAMEEDILTTAQWQIDNYESIDYLEFDRKLQAKLIEVSESVGCDPTQVATCRKMLNDKLAYMEQIAFDCVVNELDEYLIFSESQMVTFEKALKDAWQPEWTNKGLDTAIYNHTPISYYSDALPADFKESFFNPEQKELLRKFEDNKLIALRGMAEKIRENLGIGDRQNDETGEAKPSVHDQNYREWLTQSFALKIAELQNSCNLSESQRKKIGIIEKAVIEKIIDRRNEIASQFGVRRGGGGGAVNSQREAAIEFGKMPQFTIDESQPWTDTVPKVLDDQQQERIEAHRTQRKHRFYRTTIGAAIITLPELLTDMNFEQQQKLSDLYFQAAKEKGMSSSAASRRGHFKFNQAITLLSDEEYLGVLTEDQWKKFKRSVEFMRRRQ